MCVVQWLEEGTRMAEIAGLNPSGREAHDLWFETVRCVIAFRGILRLKKNKFCYYFPIFENSEKQIDL